MVQGKTDSIALVINISQYIATWQNYHCIWKLLLSL